MYAGKINSPTTTLDGGISNVAATISVVDASVFPAAPNIAVIGNGANAETILYAGKSSNDLTSVTREFQGSKIAWDSGTVISRNFTAYDYDTQRTNLGTLNTDKYESGSSAALAGIVVDGNKNATPGDGAMLHVDTSTITDNATSGSGTAAKYTHVTFEAPTLAATNSSVTTSDAATMYINNAATAGTNQTITRNWAVWVDAGNVRFDGSIYSGTTEAINSSGLVTVANQSNITGVSTITSGTWEGTTVAVAQGGTGATTLSNLITMGTHTSGNYVATVTAGTGLTSTGGTSGESIAHSLSVDASQTQITAVGTIATGTWEGTTVAVAQGGTGATSLSNLITLATHTTGDYVQNITAGTGLTSSGATSGENIAHSLSVDASQTQITAVGTIATGTWAATDVAVAHGGTGASTATAGFDALSPMTTEGDILYGGSSGTVTRLARGSDNQTLMMNGNVPNWETVTVGATVGLSVAMAIAL